jgi:hypothetical protein
MESFIGGAEKLSVLLLVALGFILKKAGLVSRRNSDALIRLVYDVFLPASVLFSLLQVQITPKLLVLPAAGFIVALSCYALAFLLKGFFSDRRPTQGISGPRGFHMSLSTTSARPFSASVLPTMSP